MTFSSLKSSSWSFSRLLMGGAALLAACGTAAMPIDEVMVPKTVEPLPAAVTAVLNLTEQPDNYENPTLPSYLHSVYAQGSDNTPANNPLTDFGATLGRVLFYDPLLSQNRAIACASCHVQKNAFSDTSALSLGVTGAKTARNSMPIIDARYYRNGRFFWDERAATLEEQVLGPIQNPVEMGMTLTDTVARVTAQAYYEPLFTRAFGDAKVTSDRIAKALAQFARAIVSYRSRFDQGLAQVGDVQVPFPAFTAEENQGKALFLGRAGCAACHLDSGAPPPQNAPRPNQGLFFIEIPTNNGLDAQVGMGDDGVGDITGRAADRGHFKSPSLRNVAVTAPYMHDGRFATLTRVVEHYSTGVQAHPNLDNRLRVAPNGAPRRLNLTPAEIQSLVAFLATLTDQELLKDAKFSDPFRAPTRQ